MQNSDEKSITDTLLGKQAVNLLEHLLRRHRDLGWTAIEKGKSNTTASGKPHQQPQQFSWKDTTLGRA